MTHAKLTTTAKTSRLRVPYSAERSSLARTAPCFQAREVLTRIVSDEQQHMKQEEMLWRIAGDTGGRLPWNDCWL